MTRLLLQVMAVCALIGGADYALGNRLGLGERFEEAFRMLGPLGLSMGGILCLSPVIAELAALLSPLLRALSQDPAALSCVLAIDMGGWQMAERLADTREAALFYGILATATLGCTLSFTIPVGFGMYGEADRANFSRGCLYGLMTLPVGLVCGGMAMGLGFLAALRFSLPMIALSLLLSLCLHFAREGTIRAFRLFAALLRLLATAGLALGAFQYLGGIPLLPGLMPVEESMAVVCAICVTLLGSLPAAELLQRLLKRPLSRLGERLGIGAEGMTGLLLFFINATPGLAALPRLSPRARVVGAAFAVSAASALTAHLAFTVACAPEMTGALLKGKLAGALAGALLALLLTRGENREER